MVSNGRCRGKDSTCQCRRCRRLGFDPWVRKIPWRRKWQPAPAFLPGESHGQWSLVGYSPWGCRRVWHDFIHMYAHIIWEGAEPVSEGGVGAHPPRVGDWRLRLCLAPQRVLLSPLTAQGLGTRETSPQRKLPSSRTTTLGCSDRRFSQNHSGQHTQRDPLIKKKVTQPGVRIWPETSLAQYKQEGHAVFTVHKGNDHPGTEGRMGKHF